MSIDATTPRTAHRRIPDPAATAGAVVGLGCGLVGQYVDTPWRSGSDSWGIAFAENGGWAALGALLGFVVVGLVAVSFFAAAARDAEPPRTARRAAGLAVVGALTLAVYWTGLPAVLAAGALGLGLDARARQGRTSPPAATALVLAVLTVAAAVWLAPTS
ncbi:hypothetical protein [Geodermatophilus sp. SYSU D00815]